MKITIRRLALAIGLVVAAGIAGCSSEPPRFDATSEQTIEASMEVMVNGLSEEEQKQFAGDLMTVTMLHGLRNAFSGAAPESETDALRPLHGMTVEEIHAEAEKLRAEMNEKGRQ